MKTTNFLTIVAFFFFISVSCFSQEKVNTKVCDEIKNGTFSIQNGIFKFLKSNYVIQRDNDKQIEVDGSGEKLIFEVTWISECAYQLTLKEILGRPNDEDLSSQSVLVEITEITQNGYKNRITTDVGGYKIVKTATMVKQNPNEFRYLKELMN